MISTKPLQDAIAEFDRTSPERAALWDNAETDANVLAAVDADVAALRLVQEAFYVVTSDRNNHASCLCIDIEFARRIAGSDVLE